MSDVDSDTGLAASEAAVLSAEDCACGLALAVELSRLDSGVCVARVATSKWALASRIKVLEYSAVEAVVICSDRYLIKRIAALTSVQAKS